MQTSDWRSQLGMSELLLVQCETLEPAKEREGETHTHTVGYNQNYVHGPKVDNKSTAVVYSFQLDT